MTAEADRESLPATQDVLITAHGISDRERQRLEGRANGSSTRPARSSSGPRAAQALQADGYHVLVSAGAAHVEVRGIVEDLHSIDVLESPEEVVDRSHTRSSASFARRRRPPTGEAVLAAVRARNPEAQVRFTDTSASRRGNGNRRSNGCSTRSTPWSSSGGKNSNNTRQLVERCRAAQVPVWHVQGVEDLNPHSLRDCQVVGLTAGTSTLDETIDAIDAALRRFPQASEHVAAMGESLPPQTHSGPTKSPGTNPAGSALPSAQPC